MFEIILNLKAYHESTLDQSIRLASSLDSFLQNKSFTTIEFSLVPNLIDIQLVLKKFPRLHLIAPHVDAIKEGKQTGWIPASIIKRLGINTVILNHTEHRLVISELPDIIKRLKEIDLKAIVCCQSIEEATDLLQSVPYGIAFELAELIGSGKSITHEEVLVREFLQLKKNNVRMYLGAGISNKEDIQSAKKFGADGILLATAFVFSKNTDAFLQEIFGLS